MFEERNGGNVWDISAALGVFLSRLLHKDDSSSSVNILSEILEVSRDAGKCFAFFV